MAIVGDDTKASSVTRLKPDHHASGMPLDAGDPGDTARFLKKEMFLEEKKKKQLTKGFCILKRRGGEKPKEGPFEKYTFLRSGFWGKERPPEDYSSRASPEGQSFLKLHETTNSGVGQKRLL